MHFLLHQMQYFVRMLEEYVMMEVIEAEFSKLKKELAKVNLFEELVALHNQFLDNILEKCMLEKISSKMLICLNQMFRQVLNFAETVREYPDLLLCTEVEARIIVERI